MAESGYFASACWISLDILHLNTLSCRNYLNDKHILKGAGVLATCLATRLLLCRVYAALLAMLSSRLLLLVNQRVAPIIFYNLQC